MAGSKRPAVWSPDAEADLARIWDYYAQMAGHHTAEKIVRQVTEAAEFLSEYPLGGRPRDEVRPGLRSVAVAPHVLFYRIHGDVPQIVRVLDGRQDIDDIFAGDRNE